MSCISYIGRPERPQLSVRGITAAFLLALALTGCARMGLPVEGAEAGVDPVHTGSLVSAKVADRIDPRDWVSVRQTLGQIPARAAAGTSIDWWNDLTNSTGTVSTLTPAASHDGSICRGFAATINDLRGIRRYRGLACRSADGWNLSKVGPDEAAVL